ncbi:MAG: MarC family protein [Dehalococcoidia bacterium]|nr:MarC family protein [Dehalococcoidia bacterium]
MSFSQAFILTFVPLFIVVDAIGNLPIVLSLSESMTPRERHRMIHFAILTATSVGLIFLFFGQFILNLMNISVGALTVAGGIILLILSLRQLLTGRVIEADKSEMIAVVPIGTPLVVGPATITTLLLLAIDYDIPVILLSLSLNLLISWVVFLLGNRIAVFLGKGGLKAISQVFNLLLAAIAVNMVIHGLELVGVIKTVQ